jgi:hypothetical protein
MPTVKAIQTVPRLTDVDARRAPEQPQAEKPEGMLISAAEHAELEMLVKIVETELDEIKPRFVAIGNALAEIRDRKLYRKTHKNFGSFTQCRFGLKRSSAYSYIHAAQFVQRSGQLVPAPASMRATLAQEKAAKTKKAIPIEAAKTKEAAGLPLPALPAPPCDPPLNENDKRRWEFLFALENYLEPVDPNDKIEELKIIMGEGITLLLGDLAKPFEIVPLAPTIERSA